jgi:sodium-dependent dicarboxylate transporter 2/3/5
MFKLGTRKKVRVYTLCFTVLVFVVILALPTPAGLTLAGQKTIAIFAVTVLLWITQVLPLMITSLLVVILFPLTGVLTTGESYALFGNEAIFFILGAFILASGLMRSGLSTRIALLVLRRCGKSPQFLLLSLLSLSSFLSFWMSEHAVAAMMFPIVLEIIASLRLQPQESRYGKSLILAMTWGCIIGGIATFLGGARAPLALGILFETTGQKIGFLHWAQAAIPIVLIMTAIAYLVIVRLFPSQISDIQEAQHALKHKATRMGRITQREKAIGVLMLLTILSWVSMGEHLGLANIAIAAVVMAFVFRLLDWKEVEEDVNWGIFLMYGGAICLGYTMSGTGASHWLAEKLLGYFVHSPWTLVLTLCFISLFLTEAISNTAVVALMMPLALGLGKDFDVDPRLITLTLAIPSGLAFQLPMGTPATAIAFSSGFVDLQDTFMGGLILKICAFILFALAIMFYWPLIGFGI